ncbi:MAG: sulfotransferase domain-containing protein [Pirellulales bacterium]
MTPPPAGTIVASFPKAGSTWVRFIIGNLFNALHPEVEAVDFHNVHGIVPEIGRPDDRRLFLGMPAAWKTHDEWRKEFTRAVLVVRNPWDTLFSYYQYVSGEQGKLTTLESVITSGKRGAAAVVHHAASYLSRCPELLVLTYEALHASPREEVARLAGFLGLEPTADQLRAAIDASSFNAMLSSEVEKGRKYGGSGFRFMRQGAVGAGFAAISVDPGLDRHIRRELAKCPPLHELYGEFHA